jgi:hypothetical protein
MEPGFQHQPGLRHRYQPKVNRRFWRRLTSFQGVKVTEESGEEYDVLLGELNTVLSERTEAAVSDRIALRDAVCRYVDAEQSRGTPLVMIIATVKGILREAEPDAANVPDELAQQLVEWCRQFHGKRLARQLQ